MNRRHFITAATAMVAASSRAAESAPLLIGQIGIGHSHAAGKMEAIRNLPDLWKVVGVAEPDAALHKSLSSSKTYSGLTVMTDDQLLGVDGLKTVVVETRV